MNERTERRANYFNIHKMHSKFKLYSVFNGIIHIILLLNILMYFNNGCKVRMQSTEKAEKIGPGEWIWIVLFYLLNSVAVKQSFYKKLVWSFYNFFKQRKVQIFVQNFLKQCLKLDFILLDYSFQFKLQMSDLHERRHKYISSQFLRLFKKKKLFKEAIERKKSTWSQ